jgi:hypothetical protein
MGVRAPKSFNVRDSADFGKIKMVKHAHEVRTHCRSAETGHTFGLAQYNLVCGARSDQARCLFVGERELRRTRRDADKNEARTSFNVLKRNVIENVFLVCCEPNADCTHGRFPVGGDQIAVPV